MVSKTGIVFFAFIMLFILSAHNEVPGQNISFGKYTTEDGLSNNRVFCIAQDHLGFLWFGTDNGLNRFDGYNFKVYRNDAENPYSISDNSIRSLFVDKKGYIWIGTKSGGLNKYDPVTDRFYKWEINSVGFKENSITCIYTDSSGVIWFGTYKDGLFRFIVEENKFENWTNDPGNSASLSINYVTSILEDINSNLFISTFHGLNKMIFSKEKPFQVFYSSPQDISSLSDNLIWTMKRSEFNADIIWIGTLNGLTEFNSSSGEFARHNLPPKGQMQFGNSISSISEDTIGGDKILWIGTFGGLIKMNLSNGSSQRFLHEEYNPYSISSNQIHSLLKDHSGVVWIASDNGLNYFSPKSIKFNFLPSLNTSSGILNKLNKKVINSITISQDRKFWLGTKEGLYSLDNSFFDDKKNNTFSLLSHPSLINTNIWSLASDNLGYLWIGTYGNGLKQLNTKTDHLKSWEIGYKDYPLTSPYKYIKSLYCASNNTLWIGYWGGGVAKLNTVSGEYKIWRNEHNLPGELSYNDVWAILEDKLGRIWVGTNGGGLNLYEERDGGYFHQWAEGTTASMSGLNSNSIYTIYESAYSDKEKTILWIGTRNGMTKFIVYNNQSSLYENLNVEIKNYTVYDGLSDNSIECIVEDNNGNLWIGTGSGISFFNAIEEKFENYSVSDGLLGNEFITGSSFLHENGLAFLGSTNGLNVFYPDKIKNSVYVPPVYITDITIFNQSINPGENSPLKANIFYAEELVLSYNQDVFSFQFTALDYNSPKSIKYAYKMEGFDNKWIYSNSRRFVTYTNLDPGEYIFKVKATNCDGVWNKSITSLKVIITPPIWATWYAYIFYIAVFIGTLLYIRKYELEKRAKKVRERLRKNNEEAELRELKLKTEAAELKSKALEQEKEIEKQKIRNRIARDLHDEIGSNLSSISLLSRMIKDELKSDSELFQNLSRIETTAKNSVTSIRDIVWFINPASDSLIDLIRKMTVTSENLLNGKEYTFMNNIPDSDIKITPEIKRGIYLIFKETLNNISKHSAADKVYININIENNFFMMMITDNGKGYDINSIQTGNGLNNIKSRAGELNALLDMESVPGRGSTLKLKLKMT